MLNIKEFKIMDKFKDDLVAFINFIFLTGVWGPILVVLLLSMSSKLNSQTQLNVSPPGVHAAQINIYKLDSITYQIIYYDETSFKDAEEVHYHVFEKYVINNELHMLKIWIDDIKSKHVTKGITMPDSTYRKVQEWFEIRRLLMGK